MSLWKKNRYNVHAALLQITSDLAEACGGRSVVIAPFEREGFASIQCEDVTFEVWRGRAGDIGWDIEFPCAAISSFTDECCSAGIDWLEMYAHHRLGIEYVKPSLERSSEGLVLTPIEAQLQLLIPRLSMLCEKVLFDTMHRDLAAAFVAGYQRAYTDYYSGKFD